MLNREQPDIDPRLKSELQKVGEAGEVEALIHLKAHSNPVADSRGVAGLVVDRLTASLHEEPKKVRYMPRLDALYVRGSGRLVSELLKQSEVVSATAITSP
jgi:hypothetical protein